MEIFNKKIDELIPYENNPRINDNAVKYVAYSIKQFGFKVPIVIDSNNVIIAGHTRLKASKRLNLKEVPCIIADDLTEEQIKKFRIADNKVAEFSEWDEELLSLELSELEEMDDFGFEEYNLTDEYGENFTLPDGDKEPFQQMTFTLADNQAEFIKEILKKAKNDIIGTETFGNENSNGNALYKIVKEWAEQRI
jgi:hypothetical protein